MTMSPSRQKTINEGTGIISQVLYSTAKEFLKKVNTSRKTNETKIYGTVIIAGQYVY